MKWNLQTKTVYLYNHLIDLFKIPKNEVEYIYKLKYEFLEIIIKWLLRYYTVIFTIFGGNRAGRFGGVDGSGETRYAYLFLLT